MRPLHPFLVGLKTFPTGERPVSGKLPHAEQIKNARSKLLNLVNAQMLVVKAHLYYRTLPVR
ncbi:hypothetical protein [Spirosoma flavum]|uniref:Uncharacterized protein n=1 Tax=Spirosoma flavum TaxID=2048557 RepID=A0ABW6AM78_9BACT